MSLKLPLLAPADDPAHVDKHAQQRRTWVVVGLCGIQPGGHQAVGGSRRVGGFVQVGVA